MRLIIETNQPLSTTEVEVLQLLLSKHPGQGAGTTKAAQSRPAAKKTEQLKEPKPQVGTEEATEDTTEATEDPTPATGPSEPSEAAEDTAEDSGDLEELMREATQLALERMNSGDSGQVREALAAVGARKVSAISTVEAARKFLDALGRG